MKFAIVKFLLVITHAAALDVDSVPFRRLQHQINCEYPYIDHTHGNAYWWQCGREKGCPGSFPWSDSDCGCACVLPTDCVAKTADDDCVTQAEFDRLPVETSSPRPTSSSLLRKSTPALVLSTYPPSTTTYQPQITSASAAAFLGRVPQNQPTATPSTDKSGVILWFIVVFLAIGCLALFCCIFALSV